MAWSQPASKQTFANQYQAFVKDIFFRLDTSISSKRLTDDGFNLDYKTIDNLRTLNFPATDENDALSVQRVEDLNLLHKAFMGAVEKLMKVYGATRIPSDSTNEMALEVERLNADLEGVQQKLNDESFKKALGALQAEDIPALIEKIQQIKLAQVPALLATETVDDDALVQDVTQQETVGGDGSESGDSTTDDVDDAAPLGGHGDPQDMQPRGKKSPRDARIDELLGHFDDIIYTLTEVISLRTKTDRVDTKVTELKKNFDVAKRDIDANKLFTATHKDKIEKLDINSLLLRVTELEEKVQSLPESQGSKAGTLQGPTGTIKAPHLSSLEPSEYRAFRDMYKAHAQVHSWSDKVAKQQLLLSVDPKIYSTLKSAVADWGAVNLEEALKLWDKRIVPASIVSYAVLQLSGLEQRMDEDIITYFTRREELYKQAQPVDRPQNSPENDKQFVLRLVNGLRDKRMIDHIRRRLDQDPPFTMSKR